MPFFYANCLPLNQQEGLQCEYKGTVFQLSSCLLHSGANHMDDDDSSCLILVLVNDSSTSRYFVLNVIQRGHGWSAGKDLQQNSCGLCQDTSLLLALR